MLRKLGAGLAGLVVAALTGCGGSGAVAGAARSTSQVAGIAVVGANAFTGHGRLAFVSGGRLYVLDGTARGTAAVLRAVVTGQVPAGQGTRVAGDVTLATTLPYPSFAVPGPGGGVSVVTGGDRYLWHGKTITSVTTAGTRRPGMDAGPAPVSLDPAWAPAAPAIAFVHASPKPPPGTGQAALKAWYATRQLWCELAADGSPFPVRGAGTGIAAPQWSATGQDILYVRDNALWLIRMLAPAGTPAPGPAARIVSRLFPGALPDDDGYIAWPARFAWHA